MGLEIKINTSNENPQESIKQFIDLSWEKIPLPEKELWGNDKKLYRERLASVFTALNSNASWLNELGVLSYKKSDGFYLELPDKEALETAWEKFKEEHPNLNLPTLDILSCKGIADDRAFIEAYLTHDILLSSQEEFVHDWSTHVLSRLQLIFELAKNGKSYKAEKARLTKLIVNDYQKILLALDKYPKSELEKVTVGISAAVDSMFGANTYDYSSSMDKFCISQQIISIWEDKGWQNYLKKRFEDYRIGNSDGIKTLWEFIQTVARIIKTHKTKNALKKTKN